MMSAVFLVEIERSGRGVVEVALLSAWFLVAKLLPSGGGILRVAAITFLVLGDLRIR
jgi:hypothetical protein